MDLNVEQGEWRAGTIVSLRAHGTVAHLDMALLTEALHIGRINGLLDLQVRDLAIVNDQLLSADIVARVLPPESGPPTIDRALLYAAAEQWLGSSLPDLPIESLEYVQLGARLIIDGRRLRVRGVRGEDRGIILTLRLLGQEVPVLRAPRQEFVLHDLIALARDRASALDLRALLGIGESPEETDARAD